MCQEHSQSDATHTIDEYLCAACGGPLSDEQVAEIADGRGPRCVFCQYVSQVCGECEREKPALVASVDRHFADHCTACAKADVEDRHDNMVMPRQTLPDRQP